MIYVMSLAVGLIVGGAYALIGVKSPAPLFAALLGMLAGERAITVSFVAKP